MPEKRPNNADVPKHLAGLEQLRTVYGERLQENVLLSNYTTARVGGPVDGLLVIHSSHELEETARTLWETGVPFYVLGSGSNVLVSDRGFRGIVMINRAHSVKVNVPGSGAAGQPTVWAESGANLGGIARQVALRGLSGLEWAASIPGTLGGAIYGNAGAHGSDMSSNLVTVEVIHRQDGKRTLTCDQLKYGYRTSIFKHNSGQVVILSAHLKLTRSTTQEVQALMETFAAKRRNTQPTGASLGSIFKNPPGDFAGRLIEAAGLKGTRIGGAEISSMHANFFLCDPQRGATASDLWKLIRLAQQKVYAKSGIQLALEIELLGEWE